MATQSNLLDDMEALSNQVDTCCVQACLSRRHAKGMCVKHYFRTMRGGDIKRRDIKGVNSKLYKHLPSVVIPKGGIR